MTLQLADEPCYIDADASQFETALINIAVNARDAMNGEGTLNIRVSPATTTPPLLPPNPLGYVAVAVTDSGKGIPSELLEYIFEPFFTTKGVGKGTGLGLPMVHGMTEQIGGRFELKSAKNEGTEAVLWLPLASGEPTAAEENKTPLAGGRRGLTVLAVDDDALVLFNTVAMLEDLGHTVLEAGSGAEALAQLRRAPVDVVVTDQAMPGMTGLQLIQAIKAQWPDTAIILATGYAEMPGGVDLAIPRLAKPFDERDLVKALAKTKVKAQPVA
jgi:CheY-like chemotaxis protein